MILKKRFRITAILFSLLLSVTLLFSSAVTVFAEGEQPAETFESYLATYGVDEKLIENGIIDGNLVDILNNPVYAATNEQKLAIAKYLYEEVLGDKNREGTVLYYNKLYGDDHIVNLFEPASVAEAKEARDEALAICRFKGASLVNVNYLEYFESAKVDMVEAFGTLIQIQERDQNAFGEKVVEALESIKAAYDERVAKAEYAYKSEVASVYNQHKTKIENEIKDNYDAPNVVSLRTKLEEYTRIAITAISVAPINDIENAMVLYHEWLSVVQDNKFAGDYTGEVKQKVDKLTPAAEKAVALYERSSAYQSYNAEYKLLVAYLENIEADPLWTPNNRSTLTDRYGVITITSKTRYGGNEVKAIPENCEITLYQTKNSASRRNASLELKKKDSKLSVAYFVSIWITKGIHKYELPTTAKVFNDDGSYRTEYIKYEIKFDIKKYYEKYLTESDKELFKNIVDASEHLSTLESDAPALCYGYHSGKAINFGEENETNFVKFDKISFDKEGGILMFETVNHINSFFLAGTGLESYFTSPIFWLVVAALLVVAFIIIKIIIKHCKYAIRFNSNGGSYVEKIRASKGEYFILPANPVKDGYVFAGWYTDKALTVRFIGNCMTKRKGIKLYAKWVAPVPRERMLKYYDVLRDTMCSYKKESFRTLLGLAETEFIASMAMRENYLQLNLALNPDDLRKEGVTVLVAKEKRYAEVPVQINISTEEMFVQALELTKRVLINKGLQRIEDYVPAPPSTEEERQRGFAFIIHNERVAKTAEDYFELLRIAVKSYVLENDLGKFKPGDKVTLARIYVTNEVACLHLPKVKGVKGLKASRRAPFADTPVLFKVLTPKDMLEAYALIDKVMKANGFVKRPENANDLIDVKVPATNGFAYTLIF